MLVIIFGHSRKIFPFFILPNPRFSNTQLFLVYKKQTSFCLVALFTILRIQNFSPMKLMHKALLNPCMNVLHLLFAVNLNENKNKKEIN